MTPEREKYLAKCNTKERRLRDLIQSGKSAVKRLKGYLRTSTDYPRTIQFITLRSIKTELLAFRHELARLKGMDRVVVPKQTKREVLPKTTSRPAIMSKPYFVCKCGDTVGFMMGNEWQKATYCTHCGRRILWEKVK